MLKTPISIIIAMAVCLLAAGVRAQSRRGASGERSLPDGPPGLIEKYVDAVKKSASAIPSTLRQYDSIEGREQYALRWRYQLHQSLLKALREMDDSGLERAAERALRQSPRTSLPSIILMMKALTSGKFPAPKKERIGWLVEKAKGDTFRLQIWALRLLGDTGWPEAVDALIDIMDEEETSGRSGSVLWQLVSAELFRVLGAEASQGTSATVRVRWEEMGRKVPKEPVYTLGGKDGKQAEGVTMAFFGDRVSPRSVFVIDTSSSMRQTADMTGVGGKSASEPKIDVVKRELERCLGSLQSECQFNVLSYNTDYTPWRRGRTIELHEASRSNIESARRFARDLITETGTNIHDSMEAALQVSEVDTVYLLSDGEPSRGGGKPQIEEMMKLQNYLQGIRVVTYGITSERGGFDEDFMKRLAKSHWGWYRKLNK
ncbi:MAG: VWA domain-containing protein [Planctomycetes bacterium]|nr:VWA domain-containing protein [Planctomycetota bacterium]